MYPGLEQESQQQERERERERTKQVAQTSCTACGSHVHAIAFVTASFHVANFRIGVLESEFVHPQNIELPAQQAKLNMVKSRRIQKAS